MSQDLVSENLGPEVKSRDPDVQMHIYILNIVLIFEHDIITPIDFSKESVMAAAA